MTMMRSVDVSMLFPLRPSIRRAFGGSRPGSNRLERAPALT